MGIPRRENFTMKTINRFIVPLARGGAPETSSSGSSRQDGSIGLQSHLLSVSRERLAMSMHVPSRGAIPHVFAHEGNHARNIKTWTGMPSLIHQSKQRKRCADCSLDRKQHITCPHKAHRMPRDAVEAAKFQALDMVSIWTNWDQNV